MVKGTFCIIASKLQADVIILHMRNASFGKIAEILVRSNQREGIKLDIKIMLLGDKQSGKSTLVILKKKLSLSLDWCINIWKVG